MHIPSFFLHQGFAFGLPLLYFPAVALTGGPTSKAAAKGDWFVTVGSGDFVPFVGTVLALVAAFLGAFVWSSRRRRRSKAPFKKDEVEESSSSGQHQGHHSLSLRHSCSVTAFTLLFTLSCLLYAGAENSAQSSGLAQLFLAFTTLTLGVVIFVCYLVRELFMHATTHI